MLPRLYHNRHCWCCYTFAPSTTLLPITPAISQNSESYLIFLLGRTSDPQVREATASFGRRICQVRQRARQQLRILFFCLARRLLLCFILLAHADTLVPLPATTLTCRAAAKHAVAIATPAVNPKKHVRTHPSCRCQARHPTAALPSSRRHHREPAPHCTTTDRPTTNNGD